MNKQELIDKAVESHKGKWFGKTDILKVSGMRNTLYKPFDKFQCNSDNPESDGYWDFVCYRDKFEKRAKELGWINGYKFGVEYPTNGKKPDLDDDVFIEVKSQRFEWGNRFSLGDITFSDNLRSSLTFRIVDERYKPKNELLGNSEQLDNSWYDRGDLPQVGTQCEWKGLRGGKWVQCEVIDKYQGKEMVVFNTGEYRNCKFEILQLDSVEFRPIKTERDKFVDFCISSISEFKSANQVFGELYDSGKFMLKE